MKHTSTAGRPVVPKLYGALMKIAVLRNDVEGGGDLADIQTAHFLARIQDLEAKALRLLDDIESIRGVVRH